MTTNQTITTTSRCNLAVRVTTAPGVTFTQTVERTATRVPDSEAAHAVGRDYATLRTAAFGVADAGLPDQLDVTLTYRVPRPASCDTVAGCVERVGQTTTLLRDMLSAAHGHADIEVHTALVPATVVPARPTRELREVEVTMDVLVERTIRQSRTERVTRTILVSIPNDLGDAELTDMLVSGDAAHELNSLLSDDDSIAEDGTNEGDWVTVDDDDAERKVLEVEITDAALNPEQYTAADLDALHQSADFGVVFEYDDNRGRYDADVSAVDAFVAKLRDTDAA